MAGILFLLLALLQASIPVQPAPTAVGIAASDKLVCKRRVRIGTLVGYGKACHTRAQWDEIARTSREQWQDLQGTRGSTHGS